MKSRLELTDTFMDAVVKMSEGNPGATMAIMDIMTRHEEIDPQAAMGGMGALFSLDTWGIYGTDVYILYSDVCGRDVRTMLMLMRATQLGMFPHSRLQELASDQSRQNLITAEELADLDAKVCEQLDEFKKVA